MQQLTSVVILRITHDEDTDPSDLDYSNLFDDMPTEYMACVPDTHELTIERDDLAFTFTYGNLPDEINVDVAKGGDTFMQWTYGAAPHLTAQSYFWLGQAALQAKYELAKQ